jgi:hypothetical protein
MKAAGHLAPEAADTLIAAGALWHRIQAWLRLALEGPFDPDAAPPALCQGLARTAFPDEEGLAIAEVERRIRDLRARARAHAVCRDILDPG